MSWRGLVDWVRARASAPRGERRHGGDRRGGAVERGESALGTDLEPEQADAQTPAGEGSAAVGAEVDFPSSVRPRFESLMRMPLTRWALAVPLWARLSGAGVVVSACTSLVLVPALVRRAVRERCERQQLSCEVGAVKFGVARLWLRDVTVDDRALPRARGRLDSVEVRPVWWGVGVHVYGGRVEVSASEQALRSRMRELGLRDGSGGTKPGGSSGRPLQVQGLDVALRDAAGGRGMNVWGVRVVRRPGGWFMAADVVDVEHQRLGAKLRGVELTMSAESSGAGGSRRLERIEVASAALHVKLPGLPEADDSTPANAPSSAAVARSPARVKEKRHRRGAATTVVAPAASVPPPPPVPPSAPEERASSALMWAALRSLLADTTTAQFNAAVVALTVEAHRGTESLRFGPSRFGVKRDAAAFSLELAPLPQGGTAAATPLTMRLRVPLNAERPELDLAGGPISLSALGVREGDLGLVGVRDARLEASLHATFADGDGGFDVSSHGLLENVRLRRAALGPNELSGIRLGWQFQGGFKGNDVNLEQGQLSLGDVRLKLAGNVSRSPEHTTVNLRAEVPQAACSALLSAVPHGMAPLLEALRVEGTLSLRAKVDFDSAHVDETRINLEVNNQCRITGVPPAISPNRFRDAWWREVKGADGAPITIQSGPGSPDWTAYEEISPFLETAILVCEDAGFFAHRGIDYRAIENSIRMNLEAGRFLRGGSTVTMQLAKNLYLSKEKTISRKFQEAVFTQLLEQELSKHELMELYLNVIEFGPGIYGVRQAARYYFNEEPRDLSLGQSLYLASILPAPDTQHFAPDGRVKDGWAGYLRKLMQIARKIRRISEEELQAGLSEQIAFRKPSERVSPLGVDEDADDAPPDDEKQDGFSSP